jgi:hypothetical protein
MIRPVRFNANARRSTAGTSHKRGKNRPKKQPVMDTNSETIPRKTAEEKELDRREQLKKEVRTHDYHLAPALFVAVTRTISVKGVQQEEEEAR